MIPGAFLQCLQYNNISTGLTSGLEGIYTFSNNYTSGTTGFIYNQLYDTGFHFFNKNIYGIAQPLINLSTNLSNNIFSGNNVFKVGYQHTGNFGVILDIQYSGCTKITGKDYVLLSTVDNVNNLNSGFIVGINDSNRLFFKTSGYALTSPKELTTHDFVYISLSANRYVNFGIYNVYEDTYYETNVIAPKVLLNSNNIYIGGMPTNSSYYTGFFGNINQAALFNSSISNGQLTNCIYCSFVTGYSIGNVVSNFSGFSITGSYYSGVLMSQTSLSNVTGIIQLSNGNNINIVIPSGSTTTVTTGQILVPLTSGSILSVNESGYNFNYNYTGWQSFASYIIKFDQNLQSGDIVEINVYQTPTPYFGKSILSDGDFLWPTDSGIIQLFANGLSETSGIDYSVEHNEISGYDGNYNLSYDVLLSSPLILPYSGYWQNSRIPLSGGNYFPSSSQYFESTGSFPGQVLITGLSGISVNNPFWPLFGYDIYVNGQKLVSGLQYNISTSGVSGFIVNLSGANLPEPLYTPSYSPTGGLPTGVSNTDVPEMSFIPSFSGFQRNQFNITGNTNSISITGFSEQVWINGLRMIKNVDYFVFFPCSCSPNIIDFPSYNATLYSTISDQYNLWNFF